MQSASEPKREIPDKYVLVSPVKDEEEYLETTIKAVLKQTAKPSRWVIIDDGSQDRTYEIAKAYADRYPWITLVKRDRSGKRGPGSPIIQAFNVGYELVKDQAFDFVVKFDCDLDFPTTYFERLLQRFQEDEKLGIASGIYREMQRGRWVPISMPYYHAAGQTKMVRAACFKDISGFVTSRGWDTVDEIKAQAKGWRTRHFEEIYFDHLKIEGSGIGNLRTSFMHGEVYYLSGGGPLFFSLKVLHRLMFGKPVVLGGLMLIAGYFKRLLLRTPKPVTNTEAKIYQQLLNGRIIAGIKNTFAR
jgi:biofilm PGA synthesis N-glycosyltransferase PgaC